MNNLPIFVFIIILQSLILSSSCLYQNSSQNILQDSSPFPSDFLFGTASSAYQVLPFFLLIFFFLLNKSFFLLISFVIIRSSRLEENKFQINLMTFWLLFDVNSMKARSWPRGKDWTTGIYLHMKTLVCIDPWLDSIYMLYDMR